MFKILDPERTEIMFNSTWSDKLGADGMIRVAATYTVADNAGSVIIARQVMDRHGEACGWCDYKPELLMDYIEEFWHWSGDHGNRVIVDWERLPKATQHDRVKAALAPMP